MTDDALMRLALWVGASVAGKTGNNPAVGCVIAQDGEVVAEGATQPPGGRHAEAVALQEAENKGIPIGECDLVVTLEPCCFFGNTPACSRVILEKKPRRVIVAMQDPHPRVNGAGIKELRDGGIEVVVGVMEKEAKTALADWVDQFKAPAG